MQFSTSAFKFTFWVLVKILLQSSEINYNFSRVKFSTKTSSCHRWAEKEPDHLSLRFSPSDFPWPSRVDCVPIPHLADPIKTTCTTRRRRRRRCHISRDYSHNARDTRVPGVWPRGLLATIKGSGSYTQCELRVEIAHLPGGWLDTQQERSKVQGMVIEKRVPLYSIISFPLYF